MNKKPKLYEVETKNEGRKLGFKCPGCGMHHHIQVEKGRGGPVWTWQGGLSNPTFAPSVRVMWATPKGQQFCHFFIKDGVIDFCPDSTHSLAGKKVEMPNLESCEESENF